MAKILTYKQQGQKVYFEDEGKVPILFFFISHTNTLTLPSCNEYSLD